MTTNFLPGLKSEPAKGIASTDTLCPAPVPIARVTGNPELYDRRFDDFAARLRQFSRSLSPERRREIAHRPRFRNQPRLRRADEINLDDELP